MLKRLKLLAAIGQTRATAILSVLAVCCGIATNAQAIPFNQISQVYFFGDSLTDSGFNDTWPGLPAGKAPTFTTFGGYTWAQYVARDIKGFALPVYPGPTPADTMTNNSIYRTTNPNPVFISGTLAGVNYAAAGSTTNSIGNGEIWAPSLHQQVSYFLATQNNQLDPNAVYFVWSGANDILTILPTTPTSPVPSQLQLLMTANTAAVNIGNEVGRLSAAGAKRIVVVSLPNIGLTPYAGALAAGGNMPTLPASLKSVTFTFNSMLNTQLGNVIKQYGTKILYIDVYDLLDNAIISIQNNRPFVVAGQSFTFVNYTLPACGSIATQAVYCTSAAPSNYLFADAIHPTDMAHRVLTAQIEAQLKSWT